MTSSGLEVRSFAFRILMKMDGVFAGREILDVYFYPNSRGRFPNNCGANDFALSIFELN